MKKIVFCIVIFLMGSYSLYAQTTFWNRSNVGLAAGVMNYGGWMNNKPFSLDKNAKFSGELMYRYDITDQFHIRGTLMIGALGASDTTTSPMRAGNFTTNIAEVAILPEYDFLNMYTNDWMNNYRSSDQWKHKYRWTPYIYAGPAFYRLFHYQASPEADGRTVNLAAFNLRWGIGIKYAVTPGIQLFVDGSRREFSKEIDFYSGHPSTYYSVMMGAIFSLQKRNFKHYW